MAVQPGPLLARGHTSDVFELGADAVVKVLRREVPRSWAQVEAHSTAAVHAAGYPTPEVLDLDEFDGRPAIVFERIDGPSLWACMRAAPRRIPAMAAVMADLQVQLHQAPAPAGLPGLHDRVGAKLAEAPGLTDVARAAVEQRLHDRPRGSVLCHGDVHPGNILMTDRGPVIIDWFDAVAGDGTADLVRTSLLVRPLSRHRGSLPHLAGATRGILELIHHEFLRTVLTGQPDLGPDMVSWEPVMAASRLAEGITSHQQDLVGLATSPGAGPLHRDLRSLGGLPADIAPRVTRPAVA